jgi:hypothetical protein
MLKSIAQLSPKLQAFIQSLSLPLNQAQEQHVTQVADAMVTTEERKTLSALYRAITGDPCPKAGADTFRVAPYAPNDLPWADQRLLFHHACPACVETPKLIPRYRAAHAEALALYERLAHARKAYLPVDRGGRIE